MLQPLESVETPRTVNPASATHLEHIWMRNNCFQSVNPTQASVTASLTWSGMTVINARTVTSELTATWDVTHVTVMLLAQLMEPVMCSLASASAGPELLDFVVMHARPTTTDSL